MKAYVCNKCGRVITLKDLMKNTTCIELKTDFVGTYETMHLCDRCKSKFYEWLKKDIEGIICGWTRCKHNNADIGDDAGQCLLCGVVTLHSNIKCDACNYPDVNGLTCECFEQRSEGVERDYV